MESKNIYKQNFDESMYEPTAYDYDSIMEYYDNRDEFKYVGIIDKESSRRKIKKEKRPDLLAKYN